jgi:DUF4097 and DUF4098 domain-containing protein YvlB
VKIGAHIKAYGVNKENANANMANVKITMTQDGNTIVAKVEYLDSLENHHHAQVDFTISVPQETSVTATTISGNIDLEDIQGQFDLSTRFGDIFASRLKGGLLKASSNNGNITINQAALDGQDIHLESDFGDLTLENAGASAITLTSKSGSVVLREVNASGEIRLNGDFGDLDFIGGKAGSLSAGTNNGKIMLSNLTVSEKAYTKTNFGDILLENVQASTYEAVTKNGEVRLEKAGGVIKISSDFGDVDIQQADNATLDVKTANGRIAFKGSLGNGPHTLKTDFGDVLLQVPAVTQLDIDLQTGFGEIVTAFDITLQGEVDAKHVIGKLNGGGAVLTVLSKGGDVSLEKY